MKGIQQSVSAPDEALLSDALYIAERAHRNQRDLRGRPYIMHLLEVAADVTAHGPKTTVVAILHDVWEDGYQGSLEDFGPEVIEAVDAITRLEGEPYMEYVERVGGNRMATVVKLADLRRNVSTCPRPTLAKRYRRAIERLQTVGERAGWPVDTALPF